MEPDLRLDAYGGFAKREILLPDISDELSNQYSIGYSPSNWRADGRFRRIVVKINAHPEFQPRARQGYTAESTRTAQSMQNPQR